MLYDIWLRLIWRRLAIGQLLLNLELDIQQIDPIFAEISAHISPFSRISGQNLPANQALANVWKRGNLPLYRRSSSSQEWVTLADNIENIDRENTNCDHYHEDYTLIDPWLQLDSTPEIAMHQSTEFSIRYNLGYAGLTPNQRREFVIWLTDLSQSAPLVYQQLYVAYLEVWLLEGGNQAAQAYAEMKRLQYLPAWRKQSLLSKAFMLGQWLRQEGQDISNWIISHSVPAQSLSILLGWQGLLGQPLSSSVLNQTLVSWQLAPSPQEEKAYALAQLPDEAKAPKPWRCAHRDLRIALPQPDIRPILEPLLRDVFDTFSEKKASLPQKLEEGTEERLTRENPLVDDMEWHLILEFSDNRTAIFQKVLRTVKRIKSFTQIMDENRMMIYRVTYDAKNLSKFWRIWWEIKHWPSVQVYINGEKSNRDDIYPNSPLFPK